VRLVGYLKRNNIKKKWVEERWR